MVRDTNILIVWWEGDYMNSHESFLSWEPEVDHTKVKT